MIGRHPSELTPSTEFGQLENRSRLQILLHLLLLAVCGGLLVGLVEGVGLLTFQKINWERWGKMIHVSQEIIWLSVLVDVILFSLIALLLTFLARFTTWLTACQFDPNTADLSASPRRKQARRINHWDCGVATID